MTLLLHPRLGSLGILGSFGSLGSLGSLGILGIICLLSSRMGIHPGARRTCVVSRRRTTGEKRTQRLGRRTREPILLNYETKPRSPLLSTKVFHGSQKPPHFAVARQGEFRHLVAGGVSPSRVLKNSLWVAKTAKSCSQLVDSTLAVFHNVTCLVPFSAPCQRDDPPHRECRALDYGRGFVQKPGASRPTMRAGLRMRWLDRNWSAASTNFTSPVSSPRRRRAAAR